MRRCRACHELLEEGVLRCRACGADVRQSPHAEVAATFSLKSILAPEWLRMIELLERLEREAPAVLAWLKDRKGPCPAVGQEIEAIVSELRSYPGWE